MTFNRNSTNFEGNFAPNWKQNRFICEERNKNEDQRRLRPRQNLWLKHKSNMVFVVILGGPEDAIRDDPMFTSGDLARKDRSPQNITSSRIQPLFSRVGFCFSSVDFRVMKLSELWVFAYAVLVRASRKLRPLARCDMPELISVLQTVDATLTIDAIIRN